VSSPKEPGYPRAADGPGSANGSPGHDGPAPGTAARKGPPSAEATPGRIADPGDVPPWQRGRAGRAVNPPPPRQSEPPARGEAAGGGGGVSHAPGVDARLNRFLSGGSPSAPAHEENGPMLGDRADVPRAEAPRPDTARPDKARPDTARPEAYASELPDLSGPTPRPPQRKQAPERTAQEPASRPAASAGRVQVGTRHKGPVRASMQIRRVDPWSVLKVSLVLSAALFFVWMIAVAFLYLVLGGMGVWSKLNSNVGDLLTSASGSAGGELVSSGTIFGGAALVGLVNIVLLTAMATIGAFIYNLTTDIVGGVEVTLADRD
jgi:hypothetical protein